MVNVRLRRSPVGGRLVIRTVDHPRPLLECLLYELVVVATVLYPKLEDWFRAIDEAGPWPDSHAQDIAWLGARQLLDVLALVPRVKESV